MLIIQLFIKIIITTTVTSFRKKANVDHQDSIIVFTTDNGGPAAGFDLNHASNWPLKGVRPDHVTMRNNFVVLKKEKVRKVNVGKGHIMGRRSERSCSSLDSAASGKFSVQK